MLAWAQALSDCPPELAQRGQRIDGDVDGDAPGLSRVRSFAAAEAVKKLQLSSPFRNRDGARQASLPAAPKAEAALKRRHKKSNLVTALRTSRFFGCGTAMGPPRLTAPRPDAWRAQFQPVAPY